MNHPMTEPMKYPTMIQCLTVVNTQNTTEFYKKAFGFTHSNPGEDYIEMRYEDIVIMFGSENQFPGDPRKAPATSGTACPIVLYVYCNDVNSFYKHAVANGAQSAMEPTPMPWGDRMCQLTDIDGYSWSFAQKSDHGCCGGH